MVGLGGGVGRAGLSRLGSAVILLFFVCMCSVDFVPRWAWAGRCSRWPWMGLRDFCPVCVGWCGRGLLCVGFALYILVSILFGGMVVA